MLFNIHAERNGGQDKVVFIYDNVTNELRAQDGFLFENTALLKEKWNDATIFSKEHPMVKSKLVKILKIQFGLSCNYSCSYCSQRFVERADETNKKDIDGFMRKLENLEFNEQEGLKIEFWGGEPLVYIKTIKPLLEELQKKFSSWEKKPRVSMITNGSLLTDELCDWLFKNHFSVSISHDGPGQHVRGPDPFDDPVVKDVILRFYRRMRPLGRISLNSMLNKSNQSRKEIYEWFVNLTGDPNVILGEGGLIDAYDTDGLASALTTKQEHFEFRQTAFKDIATTGGAIGFVGILEKIDGFTNAVLSHKPSRSLGQKCGMDDDNILAVDLKGNVITCQNVSAVSTAGNGMPHIGGNIVNMDAVKIRTTTHWSNRPDCANCPVLHICQGSCMYLQEEYWDKSCDNAYSDAVALFALSLEKITGYIPYLIEADHLPPERQDIWGWTLQHPEEENRDLVSLHPVIQTKMVVEDVEVYTQAVVGK
jgi:uncharacterized protein